MEAEELPHCPQRDGEIRDGGILNREDGGFRAGEEELRRDLEEGGGYMEAAAVVEGPGGVEGEGMGGRKRVYGCGVFCR